MPLLDAQNLTKYFGGLAAVNRVDLAVEEGEIVGLIGPNGAGKTTCFNLLSGFLPPTAGTITFRGQLLTGLKPHHIVARGLVRTFQHTTLFQDMTVLQNVLMGLHLHSQRGLGQVLCSRRSFPQHEIDHGYEVLAFTGLDALHAWRADARPVPVTVDRAAQTAQNEDLAAVLIDVAGPHALVIEGEVLQELAAGHRLVELSDGDFGLVTAVLPRE